MGYPSCGTAPLRSLFEPETRHIAAAICAIHSLFKVGDADDVLACIAPRPFMELMPDRAFPEGFLEKLYSKARDRYRQLGVEDRFVILVFPEDTNSLRRSKKRLIAGLIDGLEIDPH